MSRAVAASTLRWPQAARKTFTPANSPLARINPAINRAAESGNLAKALALAKQLRHVYKHQAQPDVETYEGLAKAFAVHGLHSHALSVIEDAKAAGVEPDVQVWNQILNAHVVADISISPVLQSMADQGIAWNSYTTHLIVQQHVRQRNLEAALRTLLYESSSASGSATPSPPSTSSSPHPPIPFHADFSNVSLETVAAVVELAAQLGETKLAIDLIETYEASAIRQVPETCLFRLLQACVDVDDHNTARLAFERIHALGVELTEGLVIGALNHFSRYASINECEILVNEMLPAVLDGDFPKEWHISPLVSAYMAAGQYHLAKSTMKEMYQEDARTYVPKRSHTKRISGKPSSDIVTEGLRTPKQAEGAADYLLQVLTTTSEHIFKPFYLGILSACVRHELYDKIRQISDQVMFDTADPPRIAADIDLFNYLLSSCVPTSPGRFFVKSALDEDRIASDVDRAEAILGAMKAERFKHIKANRRTYETIIDVYLYSSSGSQIWELAFDYLEEMKHYNYLPSPFVYVGILNRLLDERDRSRQVQNSIPVPLYSETLGKESDVRIRLILEEMAALGYLGGKTKNALSRSVLSRTLRMRLGSRAVENVMAGLVVERKPTASSGPRSDPLSLAFE